MLYRGSRITAIAPQIENTPQEYLDTARVEIADAEGRFLFENVAPGEYFLQTQVFWTVGDNIFPEGGSFYEEVTVTGDETTRVVLSGR